MTQNYTAKITKNSFWSTISFIIASLCNFGMSIAITRYFGKEEYGQYSYFLWLSSVLGILAGFGFQQTLSRHLPKYFFADSPEQKEKTAIIFRKLFKVQLFGSIIIAAICALNIKFFESAIQFNHPQKNLLLIITFLSMIPVSMNTFLSSSFSAIQEFQKISRIYIGTSIINLVLIIIFVITRQPMANFLWLYVGLTILSSSILLSQTNPLFKKATQVAQVHHNEKLFSYSLYAYIGILCTQIVWERSELFFLGMFSDSSQIAIYTLAYALAVLFISVWGPLNGVMNATTSEVVMTEKQDKLLLITQHGTKYMAMLMLPLSLIASLFLKDVVGLIYGVSFQDVALLFPPLVISHVIAIIITPAGSIPMLKHEMRKSMIFNIATAIVNIGLDFYLIARYQAAGAMLANVISQIFSIGLSLINAKKYHLGIFNKYMIRIFLLNSLIAAIFLFISNLSLMTRLSIAILMTILYLMVIIKIAFNEKDAQILKNLFEVIPKSARKPVNWIYQKIRYN